jgi:hypothetical protein
MAGFAYIGAFTGEITDKSMRVLGAGFFAVLLNDPPEGRR